MANRTVHVSPVLRSDMLVFQTLCKHVPSCFRVSVIHAYVFALDCTSPIHTMHGLVQRSLANTARSDSQALKRLKNNPTDRHQRKRPGNHIARCPLSGSYGVDPWEV